MDSAVTAATAASGHDLALLHANYGQRTERKELACFHALADHYGARARLVVEVAKQGLGCGYIEVVLPHHPDNLSWTADGRLLVAGQIGSTRAAFGCLDGSVRRCGQPWSVPAIDPETLTITTIAEGDGREFGAASSAILVGDTLVIGTWSGDRVLRRPAP